MSDRIFQNVITRMKESIDGVIGVVDEKGYVIASSNLSLVGSVLEGFDYEYFMENRESLVTRDRVFCPVDTDSAGIQYIAFAEGTGAAVKAVCSVAAVAFNEARINYEEKHNKAAFVKNIISDNILPGDVYVRAKELHFTTDEPRSVILVRQLENADVSAVEFIQKLFPDRQRDFVLNINETDVVIIKTLSAKSTREDVLNIAANVEKMLARELGIRTVIGISTNAKHLRELADRYKEAQVAIDVGRIFENEKSIICYETLGLGRIIYQLPTTLCEMFLREVFKKNPIETLDEDTLETINKFFENNLNVSETSRKLYVHRNTLVYRLEKIKKITGLDLREFDHAIVFKVAMMVKMYLDSINATVKY